MYYLLPRARQNLLLLAASYLFLISISWRFALTLLIMTLASYAAGLRSAGKKRPRLWLGLGVGFNLAVWLYFTGAAFFIPQMSSWLAGMGWDAPVRALGVLLPVGISFYTLQAISYLLDSYRGQIGTPPPLWDFALYLAYFPKLTAGPIERPRDFLLQLARPRAVDNELMARSFYLIVLGLVRKIVIADTLLAAMPARVFLSPADYSGVELVSWLLAAAFGLYNNFCGYTDIVRGISGFFGISLSSNFSRPFFSRSFSELWNRWHSSLSHWLRDYVYFPLSRSLLKRDPGMRNRANIMLPPLAAMLASGLWHGLAPRYLAWGLLMGIYLMAENLRSATRPARRWDRMPGWRQWLATARVMVLALAAFAVFSMEPRVAGQFFLRLFSFESWTLPSSRVFLFMIPSLWIDYVQSRHGDDFAFLAWKRPARAALLALALLAIFLLAQTKVGEPFIYQGF
jgi:D-alanyl-lipoteichoic acid acyltransferase DltB (MBOAT superfamily)